MTGEQRFDPGDDLEQRVIEWVSTLSQPECVSVVGYILDALIRTAKGVTAETVLGFVNSTQVYSSVAMYATRRCFEVYGLPHAGDGIRGDLQAFMRGLADDINARMDAELRRREGGL